MDKVSVLSQKEEKGEENEEKEVPQVLTSHEDANKAIVKNFILFYYFFFWVKDRTPRDSVYCCLQTSQLTLVKKKEDKKTIADQDRRVKIKQE